MTIRHKIAAGVAALTLALGASVAVAAPANATWGSTVRVLGGSTSFVVENMYGNYFTLGQYASLQNVKRVAIHPNRCAAVGPTIYCAGSTTRWITLSYVKTYSLTYNVA